MHTPATRNPQLQAPGLLQRWATTLHDMSERARTRRLLAQMDERQLADCGINHCERVQELHKPFWR